MNERKHRAPSAASASSCPPSTSDGSFFMGDQKTPATGNSGLLVRKWRQCSTCGGSRYVAAWDASERYTNVCDDCDGEGGTWV